MRTGFARYHVEADILIDAAPDEVWRVLTDFPGYDAWNPMITEVEGAPEKGCALSFTVTDALGSRKRMGSRVHEIVSGKRLEWRGGSPLTFIGHHYYELEPEGEGTRFRHGERYFGLAPMLLKRILDARAAPLYPRLNEALKRHLETR